MDLNLGIMLVSEVLIYPGLMFLVATIIFTQWLWRKIAARLGFRRGPMKTGPAGVLQPLADLLKLLSKEEVRTALSSKRLPALIAPLGIGALSTVLLTTPLAPLPIWSPFDSLVVLYLILWATVSIVILALSTPNPYTNIGVGRYLAFIVAAEPPFFISVLVPIILASRYYSDVNYSIYKTSLYSSSLWGLNPLTATLMLLSAFSGFISMMAVMNIKPFDAAEAETEIYWGIFTEFGGPRLALGMFISFAERVVLPLIYTFLFLGGSSPFTFTDNYLASLITTLIKFFVIFSILAIIDTLMPRFRPDQAVRFLIKYALTTAVIALIASITLTFIY